MCILSGGWSGCCGGRGLIGQGPPASCHHGLTDKHTHPPLKALCLQRPPQHTSISLSPAQPPTRERGRVLCISLHFILPISICVLHQLCCNARPACWWGPSQRGTITLWWGRSLPAQGQSEYCPLIHIKDNSIWRWTDLIVEENCIKMEGCGLSGLKNPMLFLGRFYHCPGSRSGNEDTFLYVFLDALRVDI